MLEDGLRCPGCEVFIGFYDGDDCPNCGWDLAQYREPEQRHDEDDEFDEDVDLSD